MLPASYLNAFSCWFDLAGSSRPGGTFLQRFFLKPGETLPRKEPLTTPLAELQRTQEWVKHQEKGHDGDTAPPVRYVPAKDRIATWLTLVHFRGDLPDPPAGQSLRVAPGQSLHAALTSADGVDLDFFDYLGTTKATTSGSSSGSDSGSGSGGQHGKPSTRPPSAESRT